MSFGRARAKGGQVGGSADTIEAAQAIADTDPLHRDGIRTAQVHQWMLKTDYSH